MDINVLAVVVACASNKAWVSLLEKLGLNFRRGITMRGEKKEIGLYSMILS